MGVAIFTLVTHYSWVQAPGNDLSETGWNGVDWIHLSPGKDRWRAVVNTVMNFRVP